MKHLHSRYTPGDYLLVSLAVFTIGWAAARACLQSITMDESATYLAFVAPENANHWAPHSNNHVLNSLLMRFATTVFGLSSLTVRLPALTGACVYIGSCLLLCRWLTSSLQLRAVTLICLLWNPYLSDFYVAARGYGLALGCLVGAIAVVGRHRLSSSVERDPELVRSWAVASALLGLSFVASFPFAFINATTWAALLIWTAPTADRRRLLRIVAASVFPASVVVATLASWTLLHWPQGELWDGARSLSETFGNLGQASVFRPNPEIANPLVASLADAVSPALIPAVLGLAALQLMVVLAYRKRLDARAGERLRFALVLLGAIAGALLLHWIAFRAFGMLLPRNRFSSYLIPLTTLAVGALAAVTIPAVTGKAVLPRLGGVVLVGALGTLGLYYSICLRSSYFYEWFTDADIKEVYAVLAWYNHRHDVTEAASKMPATDNLEFYRRVSGGRETLAPFRPTDQMPVTRNVYVLYESQDRDFIAQQELKIVYRGRVFGDLVVAIRPELETRGTLSLHR